MLHFVGNTRNDIAVYVNLIQYDIARQISWQPQLLTLVREVLEQASPRGKSLVIERDMGRSIGYSFVVPTTDTSKVFYAKPLRDDVYMRFVRDVPPVSTRFLTLVLNRADDGSYELQSINIGKVIPPRTGSVGDTPDSRSYWERHAYVFDKQPLQARTLIKQCPY